MSTAKLFKEITKIVFSCFHIPIKILNKTGVTDKTYSQLHELHQKYSDAGLAILGFPCNQFRQEPGTNTDIEQFARNKFDVKFDLFSKVNVNGSQADPLFNYLKTHKNAKGFLTNHVKWSWTKFLVDRNGVPQKRYGTNEDPVTFEPDIKGLL